MIALLTGKVVEREDKALIVDAQGVGYRVFVMSSVRESAKIDELITLKIYHHITDSDQLLFGFINAEQLAYYHLLLSVPSIGPKTAMNVLDVASPQVLAQAVAEEDKTLLTKIAGVGKKTAERIVMELKGKIPEITFKKKISAPLHQETIEALVSIGYTPAQARTSVSKLPKNITTVEEAIRFALKTAVV